MFVWGTVTGDSLHAVTDAGVVAVAVFQLSGALVPVNLFIQTERADIRQLRNAVIASHHGRDARQKVPAAIGKADTVSHQQPFMPAAGQEVYLQPSENWTAETATAVGRVEVMTRTCFEGG